MRPLQNALLLLLLLGETLALVSLPLDSFKPDSLHAQIEAENKTIRNKIDSIVVRAFIENPSKTDYNLYLMREENNRWKLQKNLGILRAYSNLNLTLNVNVEYPGQSEKITRFALLASADEKNFIGKEFEIKEDWSAYEMGVREILARANLFIVPLVSLFLILLIFFLAELAYKQRAFGYEYTTRTLFFPVMRGRALEEKVADLMINPFFWFFEILCISVLASIIFSSNLLSIGAETGFIVFVLSGLGALFLPFLYFAFAWYIEYYEKKPLRFFFSLFLWGTFAAFLSFIFNSMQTSLFTNVLFGTIIIAPIIEEVTKAIGIYILAGHHEFDDTQAGIIFGFVLGLGFSFVENWFYFSARANPFQLGLLSWFSIILYRSFFNSLAHGTFTSATAGVIGYMKCHPNVQRYAKLGIIPGIFLAIALHALFNLTALFDGYLIAHYGFPLFTFNPLYVIILTISFLAILLLATKESEALRARRRVLAEIGASYKLL